MYSNTFSLLWCNSKKSSLDAWTSVNNFSALGDLAKVNSWSRSTAENGESWNYYKMHTGKEDASQGPWSMLQVPLAPIKSPLSQVGIQSFRGRHGR